MSRHKIGNLTDEELAADIASESSFDKPNTDHLSLLLDERERREFTDVLMDCEGLLLGWVSDGTLGPLVINLRSRQELSRTLVRIRNVLGPRMSRKTRSK